MVEGGAGGRLDAEAGDQARQHDRRDPALGQHRVQPGLMECAEGAFDDDGLVRARGARRVQVAAGRLLVGPGTLDPDPHHQGARAPGVLGQRQAPVAHFGTGPGMGFQGDDAGHEVDEDEGAAAGVDFHAPMVHWTNEPVAGAVSIWEAA